MVSRPVSRPILSGLGLGLGLGGCGLGLGLGLEPSGLGVLARDQSRPGFLRAPKGGEECIL